MALCSCQDYPGYAQWKVAKSQQPGVSLYEEDNRQDNNCIYSIFNIKYSTIYSLQYINDPPYDSYSLTSLPPSHIEGSR